MEDLKIKMIKNKECKGSVRYNAVDRDAPVICIYVSRKVLNPTIPEVIVVEVKTEGE